MLQIKMIFRYLKYVLSHKYYVFLAGRKIGVSLWQLAVHDLSKFGRHEFMQYARKYSYPAVGGVWPSRGLIASYVGHTQESVDEAFNYAWLNHANKNPHHWQYWIVCENGGDSKVLDMPKKYAREMVADWMGAGRAITGSWDMTDWLHQNLYKVVVSKNTLLFIESILSDLGYNTEDTAPYLC